jgi:uncharacterized protein (DUF2147 family)
MRWKTPGLAVLLAFSPAAQADAAGVTGLWRTADNGGLVRIEACGEAICGRIANSSPEYAAQKDVHNRDPALRDHPITGLLIMKLTPTGPGRWGKGWIYNPDDGRSYQASVTLSDDGRLRLKGCLVAPLCRTQIWTRAGALAGRDPTAAAPPS